MANNITLSYPSAFHHQFLDRNGKPLTGGKLYTYSAGTPTPIPTYKTIGDISSTNTNTNPIILDNAGMAYIVIETDKAYKFVLFDKNDAKIAEWDNVTGNIGGGGCGSEDIVVVGTPNEIDVSGSVTQGVKRYVISLSNSVKSTILYLVGLYNNVLNSLGNKADKVQGATAGNIAALDANGNLTDSGSKVADFKTKQTPVADPIASGAGLEFIDSVSQDENGKITPHKKSVQDGTTAQKGVVKLSNAIDSTSVTEAATPKAVKDAYDELNNKIVARAVFLSQAEWAVQSQLQGDPAKVYYVENGTGEDAYTVYVWRESTSTYEEVDESSIDLDGYWHDSPTTTGSGNVVTNITLGNDGVPQVEKGMSAEPAFSVLPIAKGGTGKTTGKAATNNLFSDINNVNTDPDDTDRIVFKYGSPSDSNGIFFARAITNLWNYIQNKISSVLGLTATEYGGKAATAGAADTASTAASGSALETAINAKQDTISDLTTIRSGASAGASALQPSGNGSNLSVTPDGSSTGYDLGSSTTLKAFAQKFKNLVGALKALAFKDKVSDSDISGTISDSHIASASTWNGKQDSLGISASGDEDKYLNQKGSFTIPTYLNTQRISKSTDANTLPSSLASMIVEEEATSTNNLPDNSSWWHLLSIQGQDNKYATQIALGMTTLSVQYRNKFNNVWNSWSNLRHASWINSGTFGTDRIANDAITADKVKDNETLHVNVSGSSSQLSHVTSQNEASTWRQIAKLESSDTNRVLAQGFVVAVRERINDSAYYTGTYIVSCTSKGSDCKILQGIRRANGYEMEFVVAVDSNSITLYAKSSLYSPYHVTALFGNPTIAIGSAIDSKPAGTDVAKTFLLDAIGQVGSPTTPIYVDSDGQVKACNPSLMSVGNATKWDGHAISIGSVSSNAGTISIV